MEMIFDFTFVFLVYTVTDMEAPMEKMNMKEVGFLMHYFNFFFISRFLFH